MALFLNGFWLVAGAQQAAPADAAAKVDLVTGSVQVYDPALKPRTVKVGDAINEGESVITGKDGELQMQMADGGYVAVRPNTKVRIAAFRAQGDDDDKSIFGLLAGSFRSITGWIGKHNPRNYQINTPTATIGVRGTDHEPLVIPEGSTEGEPGTYDKVNAGGSYIQTPQGRVEVPEHRAAFVPHAGRVAPRLLDKVPGFFRPTRNEHLLEHRHEAIQRTLEQKRDERRKFIEQRKAATAKPGERQRPDLRAERQAQRQDLREQRQKERQDLRGQRQQPKGDLREQRQEQRRELQEQRRQKQEERKPERKKGRAEERQENHPRRGHRG